MKLGYFKTTTEAWYDFRKGEGLNLFHGFIPLDIKVDHMRNEVTYGGFHEDFDEIPDYIVPPFYDAIFTNDSVYPTWRRING